MVLDTYGFRHPPFQMTPDARLFFPSTVHSRAYAHLLYGLSQREGFVVVTGEVGAGKTTLIERLCAEFSPQGHAIARVMTTQVTAGDLLRLVAVAFDVPSKGAKSQLLQGIVATLRRGIAERGRRHILIVDEAQALPVSSLEELRMLSNIAEGEHALLQVVLMGQPQLRQTLARPDLDQLRQRVLAAYHLAALTREETHLYVRHRMTSVGWSGHPAWEPAALDLVHVHSGGIPRRINRLCSRVLLAAALERATVLTAELVSITAEELTHDLGVITAEEPAQDLGVVTAAAPPPQIAAATPTRDLGVIHTNAPPPQITTEALTQDLGVLRNMAPPPQIATETPTQDLGVLRDMAPPPQIATGALTQDLGVLRDKAPLSFSEEDRATVRALAERVDQLERAALHRERMLLRLREVAKQAASASGGA